MRQRTRFYSLLLLLENLHLNLVHLYPAMCKDILLAMFDTSGNNGIVRTAIDWKSMALALSTCLIAVLKWDISCCF